MNIEPVLPQLLCSCGSLFFAVVAAVFLVILIRSARQRQRLQTTLANIPLQSVAALRPGPGLVRLKGVIAQVPEPVPPLLDIAVVRVAIKTGRPGEEDRQQMDRVQVRPFLLDDGTGTVWVDPTGLDRFLLGEGIHSGGRRPGRRPAGRGASPHPGWTRPGLGAARRAGSHRCGNHPAEGRPDRHRQSERATPGGRPGRHPGHRRSDPTTVHRGLGGGRFAGPAHPVPAVGGWHYVDPGVGDAAGLILKTGHGCTQILRISTASPRGLCPKG